MKFHTDLVVSVECKWWINLSSFHLTFRSSVTDNEHVSTCCQVCLMVWGETDLEKHAENAALGEFQHSVKRCKWRGKWSVVLCWINWTKLFSILLKVFWLCSHIEIWLLQRLEIVLLLYYLFLWFFSLSSAASLPINSIFHFFWLLKFAVKTLNCSRRLVFWGGGSNYEGMAASVCYCLQKVPVWRIRVEQQC